MVLRGKVAVVTGASSGIGAAIAIDLGKKGADVVIVGRNENKLSKVVVDFEKAAGKKPIVVAVDITDDDAAKRVIDVTISTFGKINILINNAGIYKYNDILKPNAIEEFDSILKTNFRAAVVITHYAIPHLIASKGNIVNISSAAATRILPFIGYGTSKAGLDHYANCLAYALADYGVRVNTVSPGPVKTDIFTNMGINEIKAANVIEELRASTPLKTVAESWEVAEIVSYLASDKARFVTGSNYHIDGGWKLHLGTMPTE